MFIKLKSAFQLTSPKPTAFQTGFDLSELFLGPIDAMAASL